MFHTGSQMLLAHGTPPLPVYFTQPLKPLRNAS